MSYKIVQPPFTLRFSEMAKKELLAYRTWFHDVMAERVSELQEAVRSTPGFECWVADETPKSLDQLGEWFGGQVETRRRTEEELAEIHSNMSFPIDIGMDELTNRTFSLAMDIGMYLGKVVVKNLEGTRWDQLLKSKNAEEYGQPVIVGFGSIPMNPVHLVVTLAYGIASGNKTGERLRELYTIWSKLRDK